MAAHQLFGFTALTLARIRGSWHLGSGDQFLKVISVIILAGGSGMLTSRAAGAHRKREAGTVDWHDLGRVGQHQFMHTLEVVSSAQS